MFETALFGQVDALIAVEDALMLYSLPINLAKWIDDNRSELKPPMGFKMLWRNSETMAAVIGGPNQRTDYHDSPAEEFFFQLKGDMMLWILENGQSRDIEIREGEVFLLPPHVLHSPQRPPDSLVVEKLRGPGVIEAFEWYCEKCGTRVYRGEVDVVDIEKDVYPVFDAYISNPANRVCKSCGHQNPGKAKK